MTVFDKCYQGVKNKVGAVFCSYGQLVGRYPIPFLLLPMLVLGGLGLGLLALEEETNMETIYFPKDSRAIKDRQVVRDTFPDLRNVSYNSFSLSDDDTAVSFIFKTVDGQTIFDSAVTAEISAIVSGVNSLSTSGNMYSDFCAKNSGQCVVNGELALDSDFQAAVAAGTVTYPFYGDHNLETSISDVTLNDDKLVSATVLKTSFKLAEDADDWVEIFLEYAETLEPTTVEVVYEAPNSLNDELDKSTAGDIIFFALTITVMCVYASVVSSGGNPVSTRGLLACGGILAAGLGIVGAMGLLSACRVKFVNLVGIIPFLIIGIGVDDMFLLMSSWSGSLPREADLQTVVNVPQIMGNTLAHAGISITITSLTDFLIFIIGTTSVFRSVTTFSLYAGVAVLFCYLANVTLFAGCLAIHGRRVYSWRHSFTCRVTKSRDDLKQDGRSKCYATLCGGNPPREKNDDLSLCEKLPAQFLPLLFKNGITSVVIIALFLAYLAVSIYGVVNLQQGLELQGLLLDSSYYYKYLNIFDEYFPLRFPMGFIVEDTVDYSGIGSLLFEDLLQEARDDDGIDSSFERCWLTSYKASAQYDAGSPGDFISNLQTFLTTTSDFYADILFDSTDTSIASSRCFVFTNPHPVRYDNAKLMESMREIADDSSFPVFAYHSSFVALEQFLAVLPATLIMMGCAVPVVTVVTFLFLPHPLMVFLVVLTILMILVGIFGFMYFWGLTLSSITMIHLVMSVGFSVDFSTHVCTAYLLSNGVSRQERARDAIRHAASPILNGACSTLLGIMMLLFSSSFIFRSFFKVMFLVIFFGVLHAIFFLPAVFLLIGPETRSQETTENRSQENNVAIAKISPIKEHSSGPDTLMDDSENVKKTTDVEESGI